MDLSNELHPVINVDDLVALIKTRTEAGKMTWTKKQDYNSSTYYEARCGETEFRLTCYYPKNWFPKWKLFMSKSNEFKSEDIEDRKLRALAIWVDARINSLDYDLLNIYKAIREC